MVSRTPKGKRKLIVFLNSPLADLAAQTVNLQIKNIVEEAGFDCIFPQEILPPGPEADPLTVLRLNLEFIRRSDLVLSVLDSPGEGVFFELGVAYALQKTILAFRSRPGSYLGKVIEGLWQSLPEIQKADSLGVLKSRLKLLNQHMSGPRRMSVPLRTRESSQWNPLGSAAGIDR